MHIRPSRRAVDELRPLSIEVGVVRNADASCLVKAGDTHVICTATLEDEVPRFLRNTGKGWVTAEYGMLPASASSRMKREAATGRQGGRTLEIQRLIGRSLRAVVDLRALGERQIVVDCDVIQADGGTRTASVTGGYVALARLLAKLRKQRLVGTSPLVGKAAGVACAIHKGVAVLDPDYAEDSEADADANFVLDGSGDVIEIQCTAEKRAFPAERISEMLAMAREGARVLSRAQAEAIEAEHD
jgi:ribonuclease PH